MPTRKGAERGIKQAENENPNAHNIPRHGEATTIKQQKDRALKGVAPDGKLDKKLVDASRWMRNVDMHDGMLAAKRRWQEEKNSNPQKKEIQIEIVFDKPVGEGYLKGSETLIKTNRAVFRFNRNGDLITGYPKISN